MNKHNFNNIDKIKTPENWKQKALAIPCTQIIIPSAKKQNSFRLATAICLTILCIVCCAVFFSIDNTPLTNTNKPTISQTDASANHTNYSETQENSETNQVVIPTNSTEPLATQAPTEQTTAPTTQPTEKPTVRPTEKPTENPTEKPTQPPTEITNVVFNGSHYVGGWVSVDDVDVFCKVYNPDGVLMGSSDLFDEQHRANYLGEENDYEYFSYNASDKGLSFRQGYYTFVFYGRNGTTLYTGTAYVS